MKLDLFTEPELIPQNIKKILNKLGDAPTYKQLAKALYDCQTNGYTFCYYLDAVPHGLQRIQKRLTTKLRKEAKR
jgi:hypothetical protein